MWCACVHSGSDIFSGDSHPRHSQWHLVHREGWDLCATHSAKFHEQNHYWGAHWDTAELQVSAWVRLHRATGVIVFSKLSINFLWVDTTCYSGHIWAVVYVTRNFMLNYFIKMTCIIIYYFVLNVCLAFWICSTNFYNLNCWRFAIKTSTGKFI